MLGWTNCTSGDFQPCITGREWQCISLSCLIGRWTQVLALVNFADGKYAQLSLTSVPCIMNNNEFNMSFECAAFDVCSVVMSTFCLRCYFVYYIMWTDAIKLQKWCKSTLSSTACLLKSYVNKKSIFDNLLSFSLCAPQKKKVIRMWQGVTVSKWWHNVLVELFL